jgi:hypothetical protein
MPLSPTLPLLHGWSAAHSTQATRSSVSRGWNGSITPGERPAPRESTRTQA